MQGVFGETDCFTCTPRLASAAPFDPAPALETPKRIRGGRRLYHERAEGVRNMQHGAVVLVLGAFVTFATYESAGSFSGLFIVAWGPVLFGALLLVHGLTQYFSRLK